MCRRCSATRGLSPAHPDTDLLSVLPPKQPKSTYKWIFPLIFPHLFCFLPLFLHKRELAGTENFSLLNQFPRKGIHCSYINEKQTE